jgi:hypothetical protein
MDVWMNVLYKKIWKINKRVADATNPLMKEDLDPLQNINSADPDREKWQYD